MHPVTASPETGAGLVDPALLEDAARRAAAYLRNAPTRSVVPSASTIEAMCELAGPLPESPTPPNEVVALIDRFGSPATVVTTGGRFYGFVNGGSVPASVAASCLVAAWDQNAALRVMSPAGAVFEEIALGWVRDILGLPRGCGGAIVTGATMASFAGLAAARHAVLKRADWDVEGDGLFGAPPINVLVGDEVHVSVIKALGLLGLGRRRVRRIPVDGQGRMRIDALPELDARTILCIQAGNVNSDSWSTDGHKWPNVGYDCGLAFVRDPTALRAAMATTAAYFVPTEHREPSQFSPEMSRRARGVELWATLRSLGRTGLAGIVDRTCDHARSFADGLRGAGAEVLNDVVINQVLVSFGPPELTRAVIAKVQRDGVCWCGGTEWQGRTAMRISVSSWATTADDVRVSLVAILRALVECRGSHAASA
jgi:glutamate/tyrosine decarboxylase-like PLP-dependent enzyme